MTKNCLSEKQSQTFSALLWSFSFSDMAGIYENMISMFWGYLTQVYVGLTGVCVNALFFCGKYV